jgi:hypothetical protein
MLARNNVQLGDQAKSSQFELKSEIELGVGLAKFKLSLGDFVKIARRISGDAKHDEVRQDLKVMIGEVRKSFSTVVDALTPFYALDTQEVFDKEFGNRRSEFINNFIKQHNYVRTRSKIVRDSLNKVKKSQAWKDNFPVLWRQYAKLGRLSRDWSASDVELARSMDEIINGLDRFLEGVADLKLTALQKEKQKNVLKVWGNALWKQVDNTRDKPKDAFEEFWDDLELFKDEFLAIKVQLEELDRISHEL